MFNNKAIGVFDSGLGGLTVVKELIKMLPNEKIVYFGDTARVPYGTKSKQAIIKFSKENAEVLLKKDVKMIVVACNSSSSYAIEELKKSFSMPIVGVIRPGVTEALAITKNKRIGVISTTATKNSQAYEKILYRQEKTVKVFSQACPLFVPLVEQGWFNTKITLAVAQEYLKGLKKKKIDTLILGCTHYPLLKNVIQRVMGKNVQLVNSAKVISKEVRQILKNQSMLRKLKNKPTHEFLVSDRPQEFEKISKKILKNIKGFQNV